MLGLAPANGQKPVVVISDTHFGEPQATLGSVSSDPSHRRESARRLDVLIDSLAALGPLDEIVLLGDIWEMWGTSFRLSQQDAAMFIERLCALPAERLVYLPGNHDYHLLVQHVEFEQMMRLSRGEPLPSRYRPQHVFTDSFLRGVLPPGAGEHFIVKYPDHRRVIAGRHVVFHHGHHLATLRGGDLFAAFPMFILKRLEGVGMPTLTREELERGVSIFYEMVYAGSLGDRMAPRLQEYWAHIQTWKRWWLWSLLGWMRARLRQASSLRDRGTPYMDVERFREAARWLMRLMAAEAGESFFPPDIYVFGHTHRSGLTAVPLDNERRMLHLVNSGCWLVEPHKRNTDHVNTLVIINGDHVGVYKLTQDGLRLREAVQLPLQETQRAWA